MTPDERTEKATNMDAKESAQADAKVHSALEMLTDGDLRRLAVLVDAAILLRDPKAVTATKALESLVKTVEATGGLVPDKDSVCGYVPVADPEWPDLAHAYLEACEALGRTPLTAEATDEVTDEEDDDDE